MKVDAVILAGGTLKGSKQEKAFIKIGEQTLLEKCVQTLKECPSIEQLIVASAPESAKASPSVDELLHDTGDLLQNIVNALEKVKSEKALLVACDIPFITSQHIDEYLNSCSKVKADIYYPLVPKSSMGEFSAMKRTYFKLDRTEFTGGNIILVTKSIFLANIDLARKIYDNRKSPLKLAQIVGLYFLVKLALGKLTVSEAEQKTTKIIGGLVKGIIIPRPEIGSDIDKEEDLQFFKTLYGADR